MNRALLSAGSPRPAMGKRAASVLRSFRLVFNAVKAHFREVEKKTGVAGAQIWALGVVRDTPEIGVSELARAMDVHQSTASNLVRSLVARGLVAAERGESDRRLVRLQVTAAGLRVLRRAPGPVTGILPEALSVLDEKTLARLERDLGRLIEVLQVDERGAQIPLGQP